MSIWHSLDSFLFFHEAIFPPFFLLFKNFLKTNSLKKTLEWLVTVYYYFLSVTHFSCDHKTTRICGCNVNYLEIKFYSIDIKYLLKYFSPCRMTQDHIGPVLFLRMSCSFPIFGSFYFVLTSRAKSIPPHVPSCTR